MSLDEEKKGKLNRLEKQLYSRNTPDIIDTGRSEFKQPSVGEEETQEMAVLMSWLKSFQIWHKTNTNLLNEFLFFP
jgi:hypothetical protein